jgi:hypothetical protein
MNLAYPDRPTGGADVICEIRAEQESEIPTVFISSRSDLSSRLASLRAGSSAYFSVPVLSIRYLVAVLPPLKNTTLRKSYIKPLMKRSIWPSKMAAIAFWQLIAKMRRPYKGLGTYQYTVLHLIFRPSLPPLQSQNPQRSPATPAVLLNQGQQI